MNNSTTRAVYSIHRLQQWRNMLPEQLRTSDFWSHGDVLAYCRNSHAWNARSVLSNRELYTSCTSESDTTNDTNSKQTVNRNAGLALRNVASPRWILVQSQMLPQKQNSWRDKKLPREDNRQYWITNPLRGSAFAYIDNVTMLMHESLNMWEAMTKYRRICAERGRKRNRWMHMCTSYHIPLLSYLLKRSINMK